jgi:hypothetical protein
MGATRAVFALGGISMLWMGEPRAFAFALVCFAVALLFGIGARKSWCSRERMSEIDLTP